MSTSFQKDFEETKKTWSYYWANLFSSSRKMKDTFHLMDKEENVYRCKVDVNLSNSFIYDICDCEKMKDDPIVYAKIVNGMYIDGQCMNNKYFYIARKGIQIYQHY